MHNHRPFSLLQQFKRFELQSDIGGLFPHQCEANMGDRLCEPGVTGSSWMWWEGGRAPNCGRIRKPWQQVAPNSHLVTNYLLLLLLLAHYTHAAPNMQQPADLPTGCNRQMQVRSLLPFRGIPHSQIWVTHSFVYLTVSHPHRALYICES